MGEGSQAGSSWVDHILSREAKKDEPGNGATRGGAGPATANHGD